MVSQDQFKTFLNDIEPSTTTKTNAQKAHKGLRDFLYRGTRGSVRSS